MGNECPNGPCKELMQIPANVQDLFTDYITVEPGFAYDVDGYTQFFEGYKLVHDGHDSNNNGWWWDDVHVEAQYYNPLNQWKSQVNHEKKFISSERERIAAEMFTTYAMSVKLGNGFNAGLCLISNTSGTVCLMRSG